MYDDPIMFAFLSRVDIFTIWQYIAVSLAIAAYLNADRRKAYILAALTILVVILYFGAEFTMVYASMYGRKIIPNDYAVFIEVKEIEHRAEDHQFLHSSG